MKSNDTGAEINAEHIHGTWVMVDRGTDSAADEALGLERYGADPQGWMILSPDGWMSGIVCWGGRPSMAGDPAWHADAPDADRLRAFDTYLSYGGRFTIENSVLTTTVEHSINPGWVGGSQVRGLEMPGDGTLILHWERARADGHLVKGWVRWRRAD